jgi:hypothetical protein
MADDQNPLAPDQDALDAWERMPKNDPSPQALPPFGGGLPLWLLWLIGLTAGIGALAALIQAL